MLPLIRKDPEYLAQEHFKVFSGGGADRKEVDPQTIDWTKVSDENFPYTLRQEAGSKNSLGLVKFMFPNKFDVYLHDTPARGLFARTVREFSHGCIRIENPIDLAEYVLRGDPRWTRERILATMENSPVNQAVRLPRPIMVHLLYWTAWVDENGTVQFRNDIYGRDKPLEEALRAKPPAA